MPVFKIAFWVNTVLQVVIRTYAIWNEHKVKEKSRAACIRHRKYPAHIPNHHNGHPATDLFCDELPGFCQLCPACLDGLDGCIHYGLLVIDFLALPLRSKSQLVALPRVVRRTHPDNRRDLQIYSSSHVCKPVDREYRSNPPYSKLDCRPN